MTLPHPDTETLLPFQPKAIEEMLHFLRNNEAHGVYNACEAGVGKTCMSIVSCNALKAKSILVICPASVILNWIEEFKRWSVYPFTYLPIMKGPDLKDLFKADVVVVSYDMAKTKPNMTMITSRKWDVLILDELHMAKSRKSYRAQAVLGPIWDACFYHIGLSGTPITNSVVDAFSAFSKFAPTVFPNYYSFANAFAHLESTPWGDKYYGIKNAEQLKKIIRSKFFVRYTKDEVIKDLPPKIFTKILLPESYALKIPVTEEEVLKAAAEAVRIALETGKPVPAVATSLAGQRKEQALKRLPATLEFIANILDQQIPLVVFTYHREVLKQISEHFQHAYNPSIIFGDTSPKYRATAVKDFQEGRTNLFIGQIIAAGTGITLTRSSNVVFAELDWSAANVSQAVDRCHRHGATGESVNIYYFSVAGSLEERIIDTVIQKTKVFNAMMER